MTGNSAILRKKTKRIIATLETTLGKPRPPKRRARPLDMLVATILSQNTNDKNSHRAYTALRARFPTWKMALGAPTARIRSAIRVGGMARQKSRRIQDLLINIRREVGSVSLDHLKKKRTGEIFDLLVSHDGVGAKTAACVLLFALGRDVLPVDTHVHRICGRLGLAPGCTTPDKTFEWMKGLLPKGKAYSFHLNLIRFGRKICRAAVPRCNVCPLFKECLFRDKQQYRKRSLGIGPAQDDNLMLLEQL